MWGGVRMNFKNNKPLRNGIVIDELTEIEKNLHSMLIYIEDTLDAIAESKCAVASQKPRGKDHLKIV